MRYVEVLVDDAHESAVRDVLDEEGVDHVRGGGDDGTVLLRFPLPPEAVESVLGALHEVGLPDEGYTVVTSAESVTTPNFGALQDRFAREEDEETIAYDEMRTKALEARLTRRAFSLLALCSTVIATVGLLRDSALAVAGAMVVSPFVGAILATNIGLLTDDRDVALDGVVSQLLGTVVAVLGAAALTAGLRAVYVVPPRTNVSEIAQVSAITSPTLPALLLALAAGAAGALALATALPVALAGVAIAIALIPAAAAVGVGVALGEPTVAVGALTLLAMNVVTINLGVLLTLRGLGYRSRNPSGLPVPDSSRAALTLLFVGLVAVAFVVGAAVPTYEQVRLERTVNGAVAETLAEERYGELSLVTVELGYGGGPFVDATSTATVTLARTTDQPYPALARTIEERVGRRSDRHVEVRVKFVDYRPADGEEPSGDTAPVEGVPSTGAMGARTNAAGEAQTTRRGRPTVSTGGSTAVSEAAPT
ncbi:DUF389 domain-containing protein [Halobium salinum]|uniref:DUF389 domain-containing protein n=1 Tax=Halobium salinum TaxID=1364940 RepID=A0ABD5P8N8_9EURY|nr:DUF389 domain-containing protein [Halobium salinum]